MTHSLRGFFATTFTLLTAFAVGQDAENRQPDAFLAKHAVKMASAKHDFNIGNLRGALTTFREVLDEAPAEARVELWVARCHLGLRREDLAIAYLDSLQAHDIDLANSELKLRGEVLHRLGRFEEAIDALDAYLDFGKPDAYDRAQAEHWITECRRAWTATDDGAGEALGITFRHMGGAVNSRFDEYAPAWSADGQALVFTSRRDGGLNPDIDEEGDHQFFSDIYIARADNALPGGWSRAELLPGAVNTMGFDAVLSWPEPERLLVYRNNYLLAGDICESVLQEDGDWSDALPLTRPVNSSYFEGSASISADGQVLYFISERPEGMGRGDIYRSERRGQGWSAPKPLGAPVNTPEDEKFVHAHGEGRVVFFASKGHAGYGDYDMYRTERVHEGWSIPVNLGMPINSPREESTFALDATARRLAMTAERPEGYGARDIYEVAVGQHPWLGDRAAEVWAGGLTVRLDLSAMPKAKAEKLSVQIWDEGGRSLRHALAPSSGRQPEVFFRVPANTPFVVKVVDKNGEVAAANWTHEASVPGIFSDELNLQCQSAATD